MHIIYQYIPLQVPQKITQIRLENMPSGSPGSDAVSYIKVFGEAYHEIICSRPYTCFAHRWMREKKIPQMKKIRR
jgi:hypothetical protein